MIRYLHRASLGLLLIIYCSLLNANASQQNQVLSALSSLQANPNKYLDKYTSNPEELNINKDNIKSKTSEKVSGDEIALTLKNNFNNRPEYSLSDMELSKSKKIIENADNIVDGISNSYTDCKTIKDCTTTYSDDVQYCESESKPKTLSCNKDRVITVTHPKRITKRIRFEMKAYNKDAVYDYSFKIQQFTRTDTPVSSYSQSQPYEGITCSNYIAKVISKGLLPGTWGRRVLWSVTFNNDCRSPSVNIWFDQKKGKKYGYNTKGAYIEIEFSSQEPPVIEDGFVSNCDEINKWVDNGYCTEIKTKCVGEDETKIIDGIEVKRDCWRYRSSYNCGIKKGLSDNKCKQLEDQGCVQVNSKCTKFYGDMCAMQSKGFKCIVNSCSDDSNIVCGGTSIQCKDGNCIEAPVKEASDFSDSATKFSIIGEAVKGAPNTFTEDTAFMFAGKKMKCRNVGYGFSDCCKDEGWGHDTGLIHCDSEEKELGKKKEDSLEIYLGKVRVGSKKNPLDRRRDKVYCVFDSKVAKIIQQQGRQGQLGISFGSAKYPDCSAISPNQLAKIDLDKVDLSPAFNDAISKHKNPNDNDTLNNVASRIRKYYTDEVGDNA